MARRPPDRSVLEEIRKLRASLAPGQFQPLHHGLGIGRVRPSMPRHTVSAPENVVTDVLPPIPPEALRTPPPAKAAPVVNEVASPFAEATTAKRFQSLRKFPRRFFRRASMLGIDALVVSMTLIVGMMVIELYAGAGRAALDVKNLPRTLPFMVMRELGPSRAIVGLTIVLLFYWLFFRLFAGGTPGEFLVGARGARNAGKA